MKDTFEQSLINRITYKGISITTGEWIEGQPFLASFGQIGLASPMEYTNVLTTKGDNLGIQCLATDFFCARIYPKTLCQSTGLYVKYNLESEAKLLFEHDIIKFTYNNCEFEGSVQLVYCEYVIVSTDKDASNNGFICYLDELLNYSIGIVENALITGNLYDNYYSESDLNINSVQFKRRDFAQMIYNSGGTKHLS